MGYTQLSRNKKQSTGNAPAFDVLFVTLVSIVSCLLGYAFFIYMLFVGLNSLIGRRLFKATALAVVWMSIVGAGVWAALNGSVWIFFPIFLVHVALAIYLLIQQKRAVVCSSLAATRIRYCSYALYLLWLFGVICVLLEWMWVLPVFALVELCLLQKTYNLIVYDVTTDRALLEAKMSAIWYRLRLVAVWTIIASSILLFLWDVGASIASVVGCHCWVVCARSRDFWNLGLYHFSVLSMCFHVFEKYSPHIAWQLYLWCLATILIARQRFDLLALFWTVLRRVVRGLFPNVSSKSER